LPDCVGLKPGPRHSARAGFFAISSPGCGRSGRAWGSRYGFTPGGYPPNVDGGPANRYASGTFVFDAGTFNPRDGQFPGSTGDPGTDSLPSPADGHQYLYINSGEAMQPLGRIED